MEDEIKSFLGSLVEKGYAFLFFLSFLSVLFISLNGTKFGNIFTLIITPIGGRLLLISALIFAACGFWLMIQSSRNSKEKPGEIGQNKISESKVIDYSEDFRERVRIQTEITQSLRQAIRKIQSVAKQERTHTTNQILKIIEDLGIAIENYEQDSIDAALIVKWIEEKVDDWVKDLRKNDFNDISQGEFNEFQGNVKNYIEILCKNLLSGLFDYEVTKEINPDGENIFSYREALKKIRHTIVEDLDSDPLPDLSASQRDYLITYLDQLISDIR